MSAPYAKTVMTDKGSPQAGAVGAGINGKLRAGVPRSTRGRALVAAVLGAACLSASAVLIKLADTGPATAAFYRCFLALPVLFVALAAWVLLRERPGRRFLVALPAVMTGVVLVSGLAGAGAGDSHPLAGIAFGLGTSVAYTAFLLI